jgi:hypothetical protein
MKWFEWKPKFITYKEAARILNCRENKLHVMKYDNKEKSFYIFKDPNLIDINWITTNNELRRKLKNDIHSLYYKVKEYKISDAKIAKYMASKTKIGTKRSWEQFIHSDMWRDGCCIKQIFKTPIKALLLKKHLPGLLKEKANGEKN